MDASSSSLTLGVVKARQIYLLTFASDERWRGSPATGIILGTDLVTPREESGRNCAGHRNSASAGAHSKSSIESVGLHPGLPAAPAGNSR